MPYLTEHAARVENPDIYEKDSFRRKEISPGIEIIIGKHRNDETTSTQAYRFDATKFTPSEAERWLKQHDVKYMTLEPAKEQAKAYLFPIIGVIGEDFKYTDFLMHLNAAKNYNEIDGVIDSPGGSVEEGLKMRDTLQNCGKIINMRNSGDVGSIAVSLFTSAPRERRKFDPSRGQFVIHLPLIDPRTLKGTAYNAIDLDKISKQLKVYGNDLAKDYAKDTGSSIDILSAFMVENKPLTPEQIEGLGFATIEHPQFKAVALINNNSNMEVKEVNERLDGVMGLLNKVYKALFVKNLMKQDVNGVEIDFGDAIQTPEQIVVGVMATINGAPAEGEFILADGTKYSFEKGALMEISAPMADETEALKQEIVNLKTELASSVDVQNKLKAESESFKVNAEKQVTAIKDELIAFKAQFSKEKTPANTPSVKKEVSAKSKDDFKNYFNL